MLCSCRRRTGWTTGRSCLAGRRRAAGIAARAGRGRPGRAFGALVLAVVVGLPASRPAWYCRCRPCYMRSARAPRSLGKQSSAFSFGFLSRKWRPEEKRDRISGHARRIKLRRGSAGRALNAKRDAIVGEGAGEGCRIGRLLCRKRFASPEKTRERASAGDTGTGPRIFGRICHGVGLKFAAAIVQQTVRGPG